MLKFIILAIILSTGGFFAATILKRKFEDGIPLYMLSVILILYIFYIFDLLKVGFLLVIFASIIIYILSIGYVIKNKVYKECIERIFTPGFLCFAIVYVVIFFITRESLVSAFDELRLWGAYPKALYYTDNLQLKETLLYESLSMDTYLPGMPLFQYFCTKILGKFQDNYLYFSYALLGASLFLPVLKNVKWKQFYMIFPYVLFIIFTPMIFFNNGFDGGYYYKTLYIDPILGLAIGYNFYLLLKNPYKSNFNLINYILSLSLLYLLKENGIIFVLISVFFAIVLEIFYYKNKNYKKIKNYGKLLIPIIFVISIFFSWKITLGIHNKISDVTSDLTISNIFALLTNPTSEQKDITTKMLDTTNGHPMIGATITNINQYLTFKNIMIFYVILSIIIILMVKKNEKTKYILSLTAVIGQSIAYWLALLLLYNLNYKDVISFPRYNSTTLLAIFMVLSLIVIEKALNKEKKFTTIMIILLPLIVIIPIRPIGDTTISIYDYNLSEVSDCVWESKEMEEQILSKIDKKKDVTNIYFVSYEEYPIQHHLLHYYFQDDNIAIKNIFGTVTDWENFEDYTDYLVKEEINYIYIYNFNDEIEDFSEDGFDTGLKSKTLYKITKENKEIIMKEVI